MAEQRKKLRWLTGRLDGCLWLCSADVPTLIPRLGDLPSPPAPALTCVLLWSERSEIRSVWHLGCLGAEDVICEGKWASGVRCS